MGAGSLSATSGKSRQFLTIGLVNNMSGARLATERQFRRLLSAAAIDCDMQLRVFCAGGAGPSADHDDIDGLFDTPIDGMIVTGAEPQSRSLREEPLWPTVVRLVAWAEMQRIPTIWSCLAAHAAVLCLDGIHRRPLADKLSGVFPGAILATDHPLSQGLGSPWLTPHSRWNDLAESELRRAGYRVLAKGNDAGVAVFAKAERAPFVFFQGHPEYDGDTLLREFRRDARRHQLGERLTAPSLPRHYFSPEAEAHASVLCKPFSTDGTLRETAVVALRAWGLALGPAPWLAPSAAFCRNWLRVVARYKEAAASARRTHRIMAVPPQMRPELDVVQ